MQTYYEKFDESKTKQFLFSEIDSIGISRDIFNNIILPYLENETFYKEIHSFKVSPRDVGYELNSAVDYYCPTKWLRCIKRTLTVSSIFCFVGYVVAQIIYCFMVLSWWMILASVSLFHLITFIWIYIVWFIWCAIAFICLTPYYGFKYLCCMEIAPDSFCEMWTKLNCSNYWCSEKSNICQCNYIWKVCPGCSYDTKHTLYRCDFCAECDVNSSILNSCFCIYKEKKQNYRFHRSICTELGDFLCNGCLSDKRRNHTLNNESDNDPDSSTRNENFRSYTFDDVKYISANPYPELQIQVGDSHNISIHF